MRYFGSKIKHYRYFNFVDTSLPKKFHESKERYMGWAELRISGPINLYLGAENLEFPFSDRMTHVYNGTNTIYSTSGKEPTATYLLKLGNTPAKIIVGASRSLKSEEYQYYKVKKKYKQSIINCVSDHKELAEKIIQNENLLLGDLEEYIKEYNNWFLIDNN